jgi:hypothetical protein
MLEKAQRGLGFFLNFAEKILDFLCISGLLFPSSSFRPEP